VVYLLYMAWRTLRDEGTLTVDDAAPRSAGRMIGSGILINVLNPKLTIFFLAFLPQFVTPDEPDTVVRMLGLSGVFMLVTFVVFVAYGVFAAALSQHVVSSRRVMTWMRRSFAAAFVALGVRLALTDR